MRYPTTVLLWKDANNLLMNYIALVPGIPKRMHFTDHYKITRHILEREVGKMKPVESLTFWVDEEDAQPAAKTFNILSGKLAAQIEPWLKEKKYANYDVEITEFGEGYNKDWNIRWEKRPEPS